MQHAIQKPRICAALALILSFIVSLAVTTSARAQAADDASTVGTAPALRGGASESGTAPALRGGASESGTAPALRGGASVTAAARALAVEGVKLAQAGHCDDAIEKLERAEALHHAPIVLGQLGECYIAQGKLVAGTELLRSVLREALPAAPSVALRKAYSHAQLALDTAAPKIARLTIQVNADAAEHASVTVDGQPVPPALLGAERPTDPGEHGIEAAAPGYRPARTHLTLIEGDTQSVTLELEVDRTAVAESRATEVRSTAVVPSPILEASASPHATRAEAAQHGAPNRTAAYVSWALSGVALGIGAGFGIAAAGEKSDLDAHCPGGICSSDRASALDGAQRDGVISTVGFTIGAAAAAVGTVLFLLADRESDRP